MKTFRQFTESPTEMSQVVRGGFPDRQFDVDFWQQQGDEAIFEASWEMVAMTEEFSCGMASSQCARLHLHGRQEAQCQDRIREK
jgi:hypothetical protein